MNAPELPSNYSTAAPIPSGLGEAITAEATPSGPSSGPSKPEAGAFAVVEYYPDGSFTKVKPLCPKVHLPQARRGGGVRRSISQFSSAARRRFHETFGKFRNADISD